MPKILRREFATLNFLRGYFNQGQPILKNDNLKGNLSCFCPKNSSIHFFSSGIPSISQVLLHQPFCMKDDYSSSKRCQFLVSVICHFHQTLAFYFFFFFFVFWCFGAKRSAFKLYGGHWFPELLAVLKLFWNVFDLRRKLDKGYFFILGPKMLLNSKFLQKFSP